MFIVELEKGVYLAGGEGDPPRTRMTSGAAKFRTMAEAAKALTKARKYRRFEKACIVGSGE